MLIKAITNPYLNKSKTKYYLFDYVDANGKIIKLKNVVGFGVFLATNIVIFYSYPLQNQTGSTAKLNSS